jgi:tetratricopeptide (TPR) repeat protein
VRRIAVARFAALDVDGPALDPDVAAAAEYIAAELSGWLARSGVVEPAQASEACASAAELAEAARATGASLALGGSLRIDEEQVRVSVLLVDERGERRTSWDETLPAGQASALPQLLARGALHAIGAGASAPAKPALPDVPPDAFLQLVRARPHGPDPDCDRLLRVVEEWTRFEAPRLALLSAAEAARETDRMPAFLAALERLCELRPADAGALLALGDYRALHLDLDGARAAWLSARECAAGAGQGAEALDRLARLAVHAGRREEAIAHLRAAVRLTDDVEHHRLLGELQLPHDPAEGIRSLTRATVLAPHDASLRLQLARALQQTGELDRAAAEATQAARLDPSLFDEVSTMLAELGG